MFIVFERQQQQVIKKIIRVRHACTTTLTHCGYDKKLSRGSQCDVLVYFTVNGFVSFGFSVNYQTIYFFT